MLTIVIDFDRRLAGLLHAAAARQGGRVRRVLAAPTSLKDAVEALGVPHGEIARITSADGRERSLCDLAADGDELRVEGVERAPAGAARFLCDRHLGALARGLRLLGFDTAWSRDAPEAEIARRGLNESRIVLSGSRALLKRRRLGPSMLVADDDPDAQLLAVLRRFGLADRARLFGRCPACNGEVRPVAKDAVAGRIPPRTALWLDDYFLCAACDRLYWEGTHVAALRPRLEALLAASRQPGP